MEHANTDPAGAVAPIAEESSEQMIARAQAAGDPWAKMAGIFKDDPLFDEWVEIMRENRRKDDEALLLGNPDDPARHFAGIFRDNPVYEQWQETMRDSRRRADRPSETG